MRTDRFEQIMEKSQDVPANFAPPARGADAPVEEHPAGTAKSAARRNGAERDDARDGEHEPGLRPHSIEAAGFRFHALASTSAPDPHAPPVVLVPGLALSGRYMLPTARILLHHYRVYVPDLPGFGDSEKPEDVLDVPQLAEALSAWMRAADIGPAMLLGNSFACQIIAQLAARHPDQVERVVLQGPTTPPDERGWFWQFVRWRQNQRFVPDEMDRIANEDYRKCGYVRALRTFNLSLHHELEAVVPRVRAPTLVVRGEHDPICSQAWAERITGSLPRGRLLVLPGIAHTLVLTSPQALAGACLPFFDEHRLDT